MKKFVFVIVAAILIASWVFKPIRPEPLSRGPTHRYSFGEAATNAAEGLVFTDSVGKAHGIVRGLGAQFANGRLVLPGGNPDTAAYGDLPVGLLSANSTNNGGTGEVSIEGWVRVTGNQVWSRLFDFGSSGTPGQHGRRISGPGGADLGLDYLTYTAQFAEDVNARRLELQDEDPPGGGIRTVDTLVPDSFNIDRHFVVTWKESTGKITAFENGQLVATMTAGCALSDINDVNVWLGRSQWHDMNMQGEWDEVRIYDHILSLGEIKYNELNGPDKLVVQPQINR